MAVPGSRSSMATKRSLSSLSDEKSVARPRFDPPVPPSAPPKQQQQQAQIQTQHPSDETDSNSQKRLFVGNLDMMVTEADILKV